MTDMSQNEQRSRQDLRGLFAGLGKRRPLLRRHRPQSPPGDATGAATAGVKSQPTGATSLWRMRTTVPDEPGKLAQLCGAFARQGVDIVSLQTFPLGPRPGETAAPPPGGPRGETAAAGTQTAPVPRGENAAGGTGPGAEQALDEFVLRAPEKLEAGDLTRIVNGAGGSSTWVERADSHDLVDTPTRVLRLAARTALDTAELPLTLRQLLGRCTVRYVPSVSPFSGVPSSLEVPPEGTYEETVLRLPDPAGGVLVIERPQLPFTPAEFARATALVELDRVLGAGIRVPRSRDSLTLPEGLPVTVGRADTTDLDAAVKMHERCSAATLAQRYHGPVNEADRYLRHLLSPHFGRTLAARTASGKLVALGHLLWDGDEAEVALIVEDDWQHRGIGTELLRRLARLALEAGTCEIYAVTQASNTAMAAAMRKLARPLDHQVEERTLVITAHLAGDGSALAGSASASAPASRSCAPAVTPAGAPSLHEDRR
ncbi:GNAT family N-acetyltransferase [Streptomyces sp. WMMB 322]|uniref:GNAT family N-acetyltransferase n=1 Tax=Streptomyces sp. WMMB 322 TaxID=1286821 RepID=UPI000823BB43|nr:GNAT family N-acetyltransferase [Streptomyces sp. WMMB 322]SCK59256.1 Acetyltransferase (GNAT) family protein [Streptomyces sp. WMMB 322]